MKKNITIVHEQPIFTSTQSSANAYLDELHHIVKTVAITNEKSSMWSLDNAAYEFTNLLFKVKENSGKVILLGNGGSAAIVSHMQNDLCASVGIRAMVCTEAPLLTALSNDCGYDEAYERQIELWANTGDMLIVISSSGQSENLLKATKAAVAVGCRVVTLTGFEANNPLRQMGHINFYVRGRSYGHVELAHSILSHLLTDWAFNIRQEIQCFSTNIQTPNARRKQTEL